MAEIELRRIERECLWNKNLREAGKTRGIIYDFHILADGTPLGKWYKSGTERSSGYVLKDMDGIRIVSKSKENSTWPKAPGFECGLLKEMSERTEELVRRKVFPSAAQLSARAELRAAEATKAAKREADRRREERIEKNAGRLLAALKALLSAKKGAVDGALELVAEIETEVVGS